MQTSSEAPATLAVPDGAEPAISVEHVSKTYQLGELASLQRTVSAIANSVLNRGAAPKPFTAVHDVSFTVDRGECFALVGANGSGKSTISRIIAGITLPSSGRVVVRGRVLPLLHVASAFHPELNGRENVQLFGTILGLSKEEIEAAVPEVAQFSGIDPEHLATPTKRFSEGMQARLAFSIALRLPADVYIFDEVLIVADTEFKAACVAEIERLAEQGRSVIFNSHELPLVRSICTRGLWLDHGRVNAVGDVSDVIDAYQTSGAAVHEPVSG